jgi:hypothetical protein
MAVISNVRVNDQAASDATPIVSGLHPVFTWDYEEDPAAPSQASYELRIGTTNTNWGDTLFVGNILDSTIQSTANSYEHLTHDLGRGSTYYCQIRATDPDGDVTTWETFSFTINQLPFVTGYQLTPASPTSDQDIELNYTFTDPDGHSESGTRIRWFRNNLPVSTYDNQCILPATATIPGESWTAKIIPSDGLEFGAVVETQAVDVSTIDISFDEVSILPLDGNVDDIYKVEYELSETEYLVVTGTIVIEWYVNDELLDDSDQQYIRPELSPGDIIYAIVKLTDGSSVLSQRKSNEVTVSDVPWYVYDLEVSGLTEVEYLSDLEPILEWKIHKTTAETDERPAYINVKVTTTPSLQGTIYDSGFNEYVKDSYAIPSGVLYRGHRYFIHVGVGDSTSIDDEYYVTTEVRMAGSAWENEVDNATGWTIDFRLQLETSGEDPDTANMGLYIHDGTYYCSVTLGVRYVTIVSDTSLTYTFASDLPSLLSTKTFRIAAQGQDIKVFMNNRLIIDGEGFLTNESNLKFIEFGDIDTKRTNTGVFRFFRYSVNGPYGFGLDLDDENVFYFDQRGFLEGGTIDYAFENLLAWRPDDTDESTKLIEFNNNAREVRLPTANRNFSPVTKIHIDSNRNKFIGTANGVSAIYGEKHDPDYTFDTSDSDVQVASSDFDRITTVDRSDISTVEPDIRSGWFTIDTTYRTVGSSLPDTVVDIELDSADSDGYGRDDPGFAVWNTSSNEILVGDASDSRYHAAYLRFPISVPAGMVISSAYLSLQCSTDRGGGVTPSMTIRLLDIDDMPELDTYPSEPSLAEVDQSTPWKPGGGSSVYDNQIYSSVDISTLIQSFIDRSGYSSGNYIGFRIESSFQTNYQFDFYSFEANNFVPTLHIEYSLPDPYLISSHAVHYFTQRTHGHSWFDNVDNAKGWRVSFGFDIDYLEADDYEDESIDKHGFGVYVNDGVHQEIIYFYEDRIRLYYANIFVPITTTVSRDYAIVGKGSDLLIYQRRSSTVIPYALLVNGSGMFTTPASNTGNSSKPKMALDSQGVYHAVWHDDSNHRSQIFYSAYDGSNWSLPKLVTQSTQFNMRNPDVDVDSSGRVWVVYEDTSWGPTEITCSVRDDLGWNPKTRITNAPSNKGQPAIRIDSEDNAHVVWEDNRNGHWEILWAEWRDESKAWISSAQHGSDEVIMTHLPEDPYQTVYVDFRNPKLDRLGSFLWLVAEGHFEDNTSAIFRGFRDLEDQYWNTSGAKILDDDGEVTALGASLQTSPPHRNCVNPALAANVNRNALVIVWEDQTEPISQIWGAAVDRVGNETTSATQITSQASDCSNPAVGWAANYGLIVFELNNALYLSYFDGFMRSFEGSATGGTDRLLDISTSKLVGMPALAKYSPSRSIEVIYEYRAERDPYIIANIENPDFRLIGEVAIEHTETTFPNTETTTLRDGRVSDLDTTEFAFGDFSENVGMRAHWQDIEMYFGYDAKPYNIIDYNTSTVDGWPNDRINDMFVDYWGNLIAATFGGLVYMNTSTGEVVNIQGRTANYDSAVGCTDDTCLLRGKLTTSVAWGGNGIWYVGTTEGLFISASAGRVWEELFQTELGSKTIYSIAVDSQGRAVLGTADGVYVAHPDMATPILISTNYTIRTVAVDENDVIWAGSDNGLYRINEFSEANVLLFGRAQGMRSSHVNDIAIVNKNLRYVATATGVERMYGSRFTNFNVQTHSLLNDNVASVEWHEGTQSLWVGALYQLHQIVFRDVAHDIIDNELVVYDNTDISTARSFDRNTYTVLDFLEIQDDPENPVLLTTESAIVYINRNPIDFGFVVGQAGDSIFFLCDLLVGDQVEIETSNKFIEFHDFNQTNVEQSVRGELRTTISKLDRTSRDQLLLLSGSDKPGVLLYAGETALPFTTIMLDRDLPVGCIEKLDTLTRNIIRFRILAYDRLSGIDGMILSNYENFTTDGETAQEFMPFEAVVDHNIGSGLTSIIDSLSFPSSVTIDSVEYTVGTGSALTTWFDEENNIEYLYAGTSSPGVIFRYDPVNDQWDGIQALNPNDQTLTINNMKTINNVIWVTTGSSAVDGGVWKSDDGMTFDAISGVTGQHARGIAGASEGTVYFGSSDGKIYSYKDNLFSSQAELQNIGQSIYDIDIFGTTLIAATGSQGRIYAIDLSTYNNIIVFSGTESYISQLHIKDAETVTSPDEAMIFAGSGEATTIYRALSADYAFVKSFASFGRDINFVGQVQTISLTDSDDASGVTGTTVVIAAGSDLFKYTSPSWEFLYQHDEPIRDVAQYFNNGVEGVWIISDNKITKWTAERTTKTVFLKLSDKAGNVSRQPDTTTVCPSEGVELCCDYAYALNIQDLQNFVNEGRIVDVSEYGEILFTYDSPNTSNFYSADQIDEEVGIYTSEILNGSNDLVSWKSITWESTEPTGTEVKVQVRSGVSEDDVSDAEWTADLVKNDLGLVSLEHVTDQYIQFRAILTSQVRDITPTLSSVTLRNITAQSSHFFTTNFIMPSRPIKGLLTANTFIPVSADIVFGINTKNTTDFGDYQIIEPNRLFTSSQGQFGENLRIGAKLLSPGIPQLTPSNNPGDPYDESSIICTIEFEFQNLDVSSHDYHFRARFYNDPYRTQLVHTFFTGNDQTGWEVADGGSNIFPAGGVTIGASASRTISFVPGTAVESDQKWYMILDAWNGTNYETISDNQSFICSDCNLVNVSGLIAEYYAVGSSMGQIPDFSSLTPDVITVDDTINFYFLDTEPWVTSRGTNLGSGFEVQMAARWYGRILAPTTGTYTIGVESGDGSKVFIDQVEVVDHDGFQNPFERFSDTVTLTAGYHDLEIWYFTNLGSKGMKLYWTLPGESTAAIIPANRLFHTAASEYCDEENVPRIMNFGVLFELENGETVKVNLNS